MKKYNGPGTYIEEHGDPRHMSRRQLIAQGFLGGISSVVAPSALSLLFSKRAYACEDTSSNQSNIPVMQLNLVGGGHIVGSNLIAGGSGGQKDPSGGLKNLGIRNGIAKPKEALGAMWHEDSMILKGILATLPAEAASKVKTAVLAAASIDDTNTNKQSPLHTILKAGANGNLAQIIGTSSTPSGSNRFKIPNSAVIQGTTAVGIRTARDVSAILKKHALADMLGEKGLDKILKISSRMSNSSLCEFNNKELNEQLAAICGCHHKKALKILTSITDKDVDPSIDENVTAIFEGRSDQTVATHSKLLLNGYAGVSSIDKGGFDYHDSTRTTGDARDFILGSEIGQVIAYAHTLKKPICILLQTDGGVVSADRTENNYTQNLIGRMRREGRQDLLNKHDFNAESGANRNIWRTDGSGVRGAAVMIVYHPKGVKTRKDAQVGIYNDAGVVDDSTAIARSPENAAAAITANWLALSGREKELSSLMNEEVSKKLDDYLVFDKIV